MAKKKESALTAATDVQYVRGVTSDGKSVRISKADLVSSISGILPFTGSESKAAPFEVAGWYRIIDGAVGNQPSSAIINMGNSYYHNVPAVTCFYLAGSGYSTPKVTLIEKTGSNLFSKVRVLYNDATTDKLMVDVYYTPTKINTIFLSISCAINCRIADMKPAPVIHEEYIVQEFTL